MDLAKLRASDRIIFECRTGSFAYGTNTAKSDIDIKGIFYQPPEELISLVEAPLQINDAGNDISYYSLRRYIELASSANPNILELMFMPDECILKSSTLYESLLNYREEFVTVECLKTHHAYALAQIKKARGRNKWINNPQPEKRPSFEAFCHFISFAEHNEFPARPVKLIDSDLNLDKLRASSVEHCPGLYRLYKGHKKSKLFSGEQIICTSISKDDEKKDFTGLLYVNEDAFKRACNDHKNYWEWVKNRNPERWKLQEAGEVDYDAKNMQHTIRLLMTAKEILNSGLIKVRFDGEELELLRNIRLGKYQYNELIEMSEELNAFIEKQSKASQLRPPMSTERASEIFLELMKQA